MEKIDLQKLSFGGFLVAIGIVFGDIGTSPLYTYTAIIGDRPITELIALGGVSAIFWTLTFQIVSGVELDGDTLQRKPAINHIRNFLMPS